MTNKRAVLVRTYSAGVHFGYLVDRRGKEVDLVNSRRVWRWEGANSLSEIASNGLDVEKSKISCPVTITLTEAIEIIDCSADSISCFERAKWSK